MKKNEVVILCLKILGIYFFITGLTNLPHFIQQVTDPKFDQWSFFVSPLLYLFSGIVLFFSAGKLSYFILDLDSENEGVATFESSDQTARIAFQVLGFFILAQGIPHFCQMLVGAVAYFHEMSSVPKHLRAKQTQLFYLVGPSIKIAIGIWLVLGTKTTIKILGRYDSTIKQLDTSDKSV